MNIDKEKVRKILIISLSNIGDVILTFPVLDILKNDFPAAKISVVIGPKGQPLLKDNPHFEHIYIYEKRQPVNQIVDWVWRLCQERFDFVVDLRNTAIPFFLWPRYRTSFILQRDKGRHMREQHLTRLRSLYPYQDGPRVRHSLFIKPEDRQYVDDIIRRDIVHPEKIMVVSPGAADEKKRWNEEGFAKVCDSVVHDSGVSVVFVGDAADREGIARIQSKMRQRAVDLSGRATLTQVAHLLSRSKVLLSNDSAPMHLASYLDVPVVALFGPTNPERYGPWSPGSQVVKKDGDMGLISVSDVLEALNRGHTT